MQLVSCRYVARVLLVCSSSAARKLLVGCSQVVRPLKLLKIPFCKHFRAPKIARAAGRRPANRQCFKVPNSALCLELKLVAITEWRAGTPSLERAAHKRLLGISKSRTDWMICWIRKVEYGFVNVASYGGLTRFLWRSTSRICSTRSRSLAFVAFCCV